MLLEKQFWKKSTLKKMLNITYMLIYFMVFVSIFVNTKEFVIYLFLSKRLNIQKLLLIMIYIIYYLLKENRNIRNLFTKL